MIIQPFPIENQWINELVLLSDLNLGKDYLTKEYFLKTITDNNYFGFCVFEKKVLIAFVVYYKTNNFDAAKRLNDPALKMSLGERLICVDTMVVGKEYKGIGVGKALINFVISTNNNCNGFIMYAWKHNETVNMKSIAKRFLFQPIKEYTQLWKTDCENKVFKCPVNKNNSTECVCSCLFYSLKQ